MSEKCYACNGIGSVTVYDRGSDSYDRERCMVCFGSGKEPTKKYKYDMQPHFEQTSEKKFKRKIDKHQAVCHSDLGAGRYAYYEDENGVAVARFDQSHSVYEILVGD